MRRLWALWHTADERLWARVPGNMIPVETFPSEAKALAKLDDMIHPERYQPVRVDGAEVCS